jgi:alpha-aminoadipate carrier protein LysW
LTCILEEHKYKQGVIIVRPRKGGFMLLCPECETSLDVEEDEVDEGEVLSCPECGMDFEVVTVNPVELKPLDEEEEYEDEEEEEENEDGDYS